MQTVSLVFAIGEIERFLKRIDRASSKVEQALQLLRQQQAFPPALSEASYQAALACVYQAQAELCGELSDTLTSPALCGWPAPALHQHLYEKYAEQERQAAQIEVAVHNGCAVIRMPYPLLRYHLKKTKAPFLHALEHALDGVTLPNGFACRHLFAFWYVYPNIGWEHRSLPDNDNYLVKPIIDTVCRVWSMTDTGDELTLFYDSIRDDQTPPGAYLLVCGRACALRFDDWPSVRALCP